LPPIDVQLNLNSTSKILSKLFAAVVPNNNLFDTLLKLTACNKYGTSIFCLSAKTLTFTKLAPSPDTKFNVYFFISLSTSPKSYTYNDRSPFKNATK
jgi:hypothetical protein